MTFYQTNSLIFAHIFSVNFQTKLLIKYALIYNARTRVDYFP